MPDVAIATCLEKPGLQPSEQLLAAALDARGVRASPHPWNGPFEPFVRADLTIVRSTWDYVPVAERFARWIERLEREAPRVANPPRLMRWNLHKTYLLDLAAKGAPLPPTAIAEPGAEAILDAVDRLGLDEAVVKPVVGASARGFSLVAIDDPQSFRNAAARAGGLALVQPVIRAIESAGETSLVYFAGEFSHALLKRPKQGSLLVQEEHGGTTAATRVSPEIVAAGGRILAMLPEPALYARIDVVLTDAARLDGGLLLMEVEVIEPELFLTHDRGAAGRFADAALRELKV